MNQQERDTAFLDFSTRLTGIEVAIIGNGTKGLAERVDQLEEADKPPTQIEILKRRAIEVAVMGLVLTGITIALSVAGVI